MTMQTMLEEQKYISSMDKRNWFQKLFGYCPQCGKWFRRVRTARQNTDYDDDRLNFFTGCSDCEEKNAYFWNQMWEDLNRNRLYGGL